MVLIITKACESYCDTKLSSSDLIDKLIALMNPFSISIGNFQISSNYVNDNSYRGFMFSAFIPIIAIFGIKDENKKRMFLNGEGDMLSELFKNIPALRD